MRGLDGALLGIGGRSRRKILMAQSLPTRADMVMIPKALFDHIPKTGGVAFGEALYTALPSGMVSPRQGIGGDPTSEGLDSRWRVVRGHFGNLYAHRLEDYAERLKITIIREPVARFISEYTYWRWNIADDRPEASIEYVQAAKTQPFSSFIRWWLERDNNANFQAHFLSGSHEPGANPETRAKEILAHYDIVGVNDDLAGLLDYTLYRLGWESSVPSDVILSGVEANRSGGTIEVSDEDIAFMKARSALDFALYNEAKRRALKQCKATRLLHPVEQVKAGEAPQDGAERMPADLVSYSANFEDVILRRVFKGKATGFYVDVGAGHPFYENDTIALHASGWSGINVEPNPHFHALLIEQRSRDKNFCVAIGEQPGTATYYEVVGTGLSTCDPDYAEKARRKGYSVIEHQIEIRTLSDIFSELRPPAIDLLKIDVEGWEERVLKGNDWTRDRPSVIVIEVTFPETPQRRPSTARRYLEERGYRWVYFDNLNDFYVEENFSFPEGAFSVPPNVFDRFKPHRVWELERSLAAAAARAAEMENALKAARLDIVDLEAQRYQLATAAKTMRGELVSGSAEVRQAREQRQQLTYYRRQVEERLPRLRWYALSPLLLTISFGRRFVRRVRKWLAS